MSACPFYEVSATGPDHAKHFTARVHVGDEVIGEGIGASKKLAEQMAAAAAYEALLCAYPEHAAG